MTNPKGGPSVWDMLAESIPSMQLLGSLIAAVRVERAIARGRALEAVAEAARGFRDHGWAKNGTSAGLLFAALDKLPGDGDRG